MTVPVQKSSIKPKQKGPIAGVDKFNLDLFLELNEEYRDKPIIPAPRGQDNSARSSWAEKWAEKLDARIDLRGKRVLEVGCGRGDLSRTLAEKYGCTVVGVDIKNYPTWEENSCDNLQLVQADISAAHDLPAGAFDRIISLVVWEHVQHPFTMLETCAELLADDGTFYLRANLHRGATASHRYRDIYFPWPHLLFDDAVFHEFYRHIGKFPKGPAWVNKLTYAHYLFYFRQLGFSLEKEWLTRQEFDEEFYSRFEEQLSKYPVFDLTTEFFDVILKKSNQSAASPADGNYHERKQLEKQLVHTLAEHLPLRLPPEQAGLNDVLELLDSKIYRAAGNAQKLRRGIEKWIRAGRKLFTPGKKTA